MEREEETELIEESRFECLGIYMMMKIKPHSSKEKKKKKKRHLAKTH